MARAEAIWWRIEDKSDGRILYARGEHGTAKFVLRRVVGTLTPSLVYFEDFNGGKYDEDNANPRRQGMQTYTRTQANKLSRDMREACVVRIEEAAQIFQHDQTMQALVSEQADARFVAAALRMRKVLEKHPSPAGWLERHSNGYNDIFDAAEEICKAFESDQVERNPWISDDRAYRFYQERETAEADRKRRNERILFVLLGE